MVKALAIFILSVGAAIGQPFTFRDQAWMGRLSLANSGYFDPSNLLVVYWNPDALTNANLSLITNVPDSSGNGNNAYLVDASLTPYAPMLRTNVINGKAILDPGAGFGLTYLCNSNLNLPANITYVWAATNPYTVFQQAYNFPLLDLTGGVGYGSRFYDYPNLGNKKWNAATSWHVYSITYDGTGEVMTLDGVPWDGGLAFRAATNSLFMWMRDFSDSFATYKGTFGQMKIYNTNLNAVQLVQVVSNECVYYGLTYNNQSGVPRRVYCDGDSVTVGNGYPNGYMATDSWTIREQSLLNGNYDMVNIAYYGQTLANQQSKFPYNALPFFGANTNVFIEWAYYNDLGLTSNALYQAISNICIQARNAGFKVVCANDFHTNGSIPMASLMVSNSWSGFANAFVNLNLASLLADANGNDGIHLTSVGWQIVATNMYPTITNLVGL